MNFAIFGRYLKVQRLADVQNLLTHFETEGISLSVNEEFASQCEIQKLILPLKTRFFNSYEEFKTLNIDFVISIGGDGTILNCLEFIRDTETPVVGVNTGRLGFLAGVSSQHATKMVDDVVKGHYTIDSRAILQLESNADIFEGVKFALNDFAIHKKDSSSMITIHTYINGEFLNSYWSDGLLISTPTGSTGYNLSCGGPILYPTAESFVITPIAPHNLNVRPIIISDKNVISFEVSGRSNTFLATLDSRSESIDKDVQIAIRKADFSFKLLKMNHENYLHTLREKLFWGYDNRNFRQSAD